MSAPPPNQGAAAIGELLDIMRRLRDPDTGCPWDLEQTSASIAPYAIEEAYEVVDAIERGDRDDLKGELGDLLLQVVFHARIAQEEGAFDFTDVVRAINAKMIRRHPHVFGDGVARDAEGQTHAWEAIKAQERAARTGPHSLLDDVPMTLPALTRAAKLSRRAASVGFVWPGLPQILDKLQEEIAEFEAEAIAGDTAKAADELGDILFVCANLARELSIDAEAALRGANAKFTRRFQFIEKALAARGESPASAGLERMETLWGEAKALERSSG